MAHYSPSTGSLDDVVESARVAREKVLERFKTVQSIKDNWSAIVRIPDVKKALELQADYRQEGSELADTVSELVIGKSQSAERRPTTIQHGWKVKALCTSGRHPYLASAATASIDATEAESEDKMRQLLPNLRLSHSDLTHSLHNERIRDGIIYHNSCQEPVTLELVGKIHRLVLKEDPKAKEDDVLSDVARINIVRKRGIGPEQISKELAVLIRAAGHDSIFNSAYEALRQTRHRAVTIADLIKNTDVGPGNIPGLWPLIAECFKPGISGEQLTANLNQNSFVRSLEDVVSEHIASPIAVTVSRVKGTSLGDKYLLMQYHDRLVDGDSNTTWMLRSFMKRVGVTPPLAFSRPNPHDLVNIALIVHGDAVTYNALEIASQGTNAALPIGEVAAVQRINRLFSWLTKGGSTFTQYATNGSNGYDGPLFTVPPEGITDRLGKPTQTGYRSRWLILQTPSGVFVECQMLSNLMDNLAEFDPKQSHDLKKAQQMCIIDYLVSKEIILPAEAYLARRMASLDGNVLAPIQQARHSSFKQA